MTLWRIFTLLNLNSNEGLADLPVNNLKTLERGIKESLPLLHRMCGIRAKARAVEELVGGVRKGMRLPIQVFRDVRRENPIAGDAASDEK